MLFNFLAFLSTLSLRRATRSNMPAYMRFTHFYPRSPCGERLTVFDANCIYTIISIHALLAESDEGVYGKNRTPENFYPRSPCGERPLKAQGDGGYKAISIHALLAESDRRHWQTGHSLTRHFYPRSPCGERRHWQTGHSLTRQFLSTLSLRRATIILRFTVQHNKFLSTLSLRRATLGCVEVELHMWNFYPRSPCGERRRLLVEQQC